MKKGLIVALLVAAIATVVAQSVMAAEPAWGRDGAFYLNGAGYSTNGYYSPNVDLRDAHRAYWDEGLVDEVGKVITLPFTLPMRVKSEWERLNTKATHWKKVREAYEKGFPIQKEPATP